MLIGIDIGGTNLRLGVVDDVVSIESPKPRLIEEMRFQADFSSLCKQHQCEPTFAWQKNSIDYCKCN